MTGPHWGYCSVRTPTDAELRRTLARNLSSGTKTLSVSPAPPIFA